VSRDLTADRSIPLLRRSETGRHGPGIQRRSLSARQPALRRVGQARWRRLDRDMYLLVAGNLGRSLDDVAR